MAHRLSLMRHGVYFAAETQATTSVAGIQRPINDMRQRQAWMSDLPYPGSGGAWRHACAKHSGMTDIIVCESSSPCPSQPPRLYYDQPTFIPHPSSLTPLPP